MREAVVLDHDAAARMALDLVEGGEIVATEMDYRKDGRVIYSFVMVDAEGRVKAKVDATNGRVIRFDRKDFAFVDHPNRRDWADAGDAIISWDQAREIALTRTGGGTIVDMEMDHKKHGRILYEIEVVDAGRKMEVEIDAHSGDIVEYKEKLPKHLRGKHQRRIGRM